MKDAKREKVLMYIVVLRASRSRRETINVGVDCNAFHMGYQYKLTTVAQQYYFVND